MPNIYSPDFDQERRAPEGFCNQRAFLGRQSGAEQLGLSCWELPPGEAAYPYHFHLADEELIVVLEGRPSLRTPEGWRELERGEVIAFRAGSGARISSSTGRRSPCGSSPSAGSAHRTR